LIFSVVPVPNPLFMSRLPAFLFHLNIAEIHFCLGKYPGFEMGLTGTGLFINMVSLFCLFKFSQVPVPGFFHIIYILLVGDAVL